MAYTWQEIVAAIAETAKTDSGLSEHLELPVRGSAKRKKPSRGLLVRYGALEALSFEHIMQWLDQLRQSLEFTNELPVAGSKPSSKLTI